MNERCIFIDKRYFFTTTNIRQRKIIYHNRVWKRPLHLSLSLSLSVYSTLKSVTLIGHLFAYIYILFFYFILYITHFIYRANLEQRSLVSPFSIIVPQLATKLFFNSTQSLIIQRNSENTWGKAFQRETNPRNLNYKVIQIIDNCFIPFCYFNSVFQRPFVASPIVDREYREMYNGGS